MSGRHPEKVVRPDFAFNNLRAMYLLHLLAFLILFLKKRFQKNGVGVSSSKKESGSIPGIRFDFAKH